MKVNGAEISRKGAAYLWASCSSRALQRLEPHVVKSSSLAVWLRAVLSNCA